MSGDLAGDRPAGGDRSVVRATAQISSITLIARIAGFVRWVVLGYAVGTTFLGNVYQTANTIPNVVFEVVAGGLLASVLVPTFVREMDKGVARITEIASTLANLSLLVSVPFVVAGIVGARPLMTALLVGVGDPIVKARQVELGAWFLRFFLPQIPLYLLGIVMQGVLHAHRRFIWPALGPLLSSVTVIATYLVFRAIAPSAALEDVGRPELAVLAGGTTLGVVVLTLCQWPAVRRLGVRWRPVLRWRDPTVRGALRAGSWGAGYLGATQLIILVAIVLANRVEGGVVAFQIANAFFELPNAVVGLPLALSLYPAMSDAFARGNESRFSKLLLNGWRLALFGAIPAAVGLYLLAPLASDVLLGWARDVRPELVSATLQGLALGVPPWILLGTLVRALYARGETARPFAMNVMALVVLAFAGVGGTIASNPGGTSALRLLGSSVAAGWWIAAVGGVVLLAKHFELAIVLRSVGVNILRGGAMGAAVWAVLRYAEGSLPDTATLVVAVMTGLGVIAALGFRSQEMRGTLAFLSGRGQTQEQP